MAGACNIIVILEFFYMEYIVDTFLSFIEICIVSYILHVLLSFFSFIFPIKVCVIVK